MKAMFLGVLYLFLGSIIPSNAEMRITPSGTTSPDNSATLHLTGSFNGASWESGPEGAVVSGVNTGSSYSLGGYFSASGSVGRGIYGLASAPTSVGVHGEASNQADSINTGGLFEARGVSGRGVSALATGASGKGVFAKADNTGNGENYGGWFSASGTSGRGVYGEAKNIGGTNYGGYFVASGTSGKGIYGEASGASGIGVHGEATKEGDVDNYGGYFVSAGYLGAGVYGSGTKYDFYAASGQGGYGPFTGAHEVKFAQDMREEISPGMIVSVTGKAEIRIDKSGDIALSSTLPTVRVASTAKDKAVFGVIVSEGPLHGGHWYQAGGGERFGVINALGEGRVWVTNRNGAIEAGDYITTSDVPGYGQLQDDDLLHSYTLGKAIETVDWGQISETVQHGGKTYKRYLVAVVYTSG